MAESASLTGQTLNQTTRVLAPVARVSAPSASSSAAALRYTHARTSAVAPLATVVAMTSTAMPHIVNASASHSCKMMLRLPAPIGSKP
jgi:hypothetical protein